MNKPLLSFLLPAYNENQNIDALYEQLVNETRGLQYEIEFLFVDDGSQDNTLEKIKSLAFFYKNVKYVSFSRNFGKESAIYAGLQYAKGDAVILMDTDLQHPPHLIKALIKGYEEGYHQVIAKRNRKGDSKINQLFATSFYKVMNKLSEIRINDGEGDFRLLSRKAVNSLLQISEGNRFSKGLYAWIGLSQSTITYDNVVRENGKSKWKFSSLVSYAIDGILSFNTKPLRLCFYLGVFTILLAFTYIFGTFLSIVSHGVDVPGYFTTISAVLFLGGIQLFSMGIIGEYIGRIYNETKKRPHFIINDSNTGESEVDLSQFFREGNVVPISRWGKLDTKEANQEKLHS